jgi:hypothetical protein
MDSGLALRAPRNDDGVVIRGESAAPPDEGIKVVWRSGTNRFAELDFLVVRGEVAPLDGAPGRAWTRRSE